MNHLLLIAAWALSLNRGMALLQKESILECYKYVSEKYFRDDTVLILVWSGDGAWESPWINDIVRHTIAGAKWTVRLSDENDFGPDVDHYRLRLDRQRAWNIVVLLRRETPNASDSVEKLMRNRFWDSCGKVLIVTESEGTGEEMLRRMWVTKKALNAVVMAIAGDRIRLATLYPYTGDQVEVVNVWRGGAFDVERELFESKVPSDFKGYSLRAGVKYLEPYVLKPEAPGVYVDGLELQVAEELARCFNFTMEYVESPKNEDPYVPVVNGTPSGMFKLLDSRYIDMTFMSVRCSYTYTSIGDCLPMHTEDKIRWVVPFREHRGDNLRAAFQLPVWIAIGICVVLLTGVFILLNRRNRSDPNALSVLDCIMEVFCLHLYYPPCFGIKSKRVKVFTFLLYIYSLHITSAYNSTLVQLLTTPHRIAYYQSPEEAADGGLTAYFFPSARVTLNQSHHAMWNKILRPGGYVYTADYLKSLNTISKEKNGYTLLLENSVKYAMSKDKNLKVRMLDKAFGSYHISFFLSRGHPLAAPFQRKMQQLVEAGYVLHRLSRFLSGYRRMRIRESGFKAPEPIKFHHLTVVIYIALVGWSLSSVAFVLEVLVGRVKLAMQRKNLKCRSGTLAGRFGREFKNFRVFCDGKGSRPPFLR